MTGVLAEYKLALDCGITAWGEFWGDPLFSAFLMMSAYGAAAVLLVLAARRLRGFERAIWGLAALLMGVQIANTPLDLHGLVWATGRCLAEIQGWYAERHAYQRSLLMVFGLVAAGVFILLMIALRKDFWRNALLVAGLGLALGMTVLKGINYHYLEAYYRARFASLSVADLIELAGIALVILAGLVKMRPRRQTYWYIE